VKLPSRDERTVWLPIDSKFPIEEYTRLVDAGDKTEAAAALKGLERAVKLQADSIAAKYIFPPSTTDFAVMYLPLEGLYAEIARMGDLDAYLRKRRVLACGPTNLSALLSTLQTGFRTVAIEKRSGELWQLLSAFKVQFEKFAAILEKTGKKLQEAQNTIEEAGRRTRTISNKLRTVADISGDDAERLLSDGDGGQE
ncbi:MAG: DNA recombination protein RmuC, partial [Oscillospiraceae bacterium]